jgi:hypothetical protein
VSDFPAVAPGVLPTHIGTYPCIFSSSATCRDIFAGTGGASNAWGTANTAVYMPICLPWPYPVKRLWWINGSAGSGSGHVDVGIYTIGGARIVSTGSTVMSGASAVQYVSLGTAIILGPGSFYMAYTNDGTTNRSFGYAPTAAQGRQSGFLMQASALPLPASATFATTTVANMPFCGITRTASGF